MGQKGENTGEQGRNAGKIKVITGIKMCGHHMVFKHKSLSFFVFASQVRPKSPTLKIVSRRHLLSVYALRINGYLPVRTSGSKINLPGSKMTCLDFCLNHLTLSDAQFLQLIDLWAC